jgi:hypothetical protein
LDSRIHSVFHVSPLKRKLGGDQIVLPQLPEMIEEGHMFPKPQAVLGKRVKKKKKIELLIHWQGLSTMESTWEDYDSIHMRFPDFFLEDKENVRGKG